MLKKSKNLRYQKKPINLKRTKAAILKLSTGRLGLFSKEYGRATKKQIEALRRTLTRLLKKKNKIWVKSRLNYPVTAKPQGIRMGKGKGAISQRIRRIEKNSSFIETSKFKKFQISSLTKGSKKLPFNTKIIWKNW